MQCYYGVLENFIYIIENANIGRDNLKLLIEKFEPDRIFHNEDCSFVGWGWKSQSQMRKYKNWINAEARKKNFQI